MKNVSEEIVLVTGASGFVAMHCILKLLEKGYQVRGTLRSPERETGLRKTFESNISVDDRLTIFPANLENDDGWENAVKGCQYILHVASPFPSQPPKHENDLILPARDGAIRILKLASAANVKRVVMTSSMAAVVSGHDYDESKVFDEDDWSRTDRHIGAYEKSKTLAEQDAWDFMKGLENDNALELSVINPGLVLGPILDADYSTSGELIRKLMRREVPGCPDLGWPAVDVRDVADAHLAAMTIPEAAGKRFICTIEDARIQDIALILKNHFANQGYKIPTRKLPNILVRFSALFDKSLRLVVKDLGKHAEISNARIKKVLSWKPHTLEEMVVAMAESMIKHGVV
jgi:nucleoside-diphosphate-sugar epimerase